MLMKLTPDVYFVLDRLHQCGLALFDKDNILVMCSLTTKIDCFTIW